MKKLQLVFGVCLMLVAQIAYAQGPGPGGGRMSPEEREAQFQALIQELELSEGQVEDLKVVRAEMQTKMRELRNSGLPREEMMPELLALREENEAWMKEILSEEQYAKYQEIREERMQQNGRRGRGGRKGGS
ncbi:MAG: hypothetical protein AAF804_08770 [Bacteroidota bacterium]